MSSVSSRNESFSRLLRMEARWRHADLAHAVNSLGRAQQLRVNYSGSSVSHWLAGALPQTPAAGLVIQALSKRLGRPVTEIEIGLGTKPSAPHRPLILVQEPSAAVRELFAVSAHEMPFTCSDGYLVPSRRSPAHHQASSIGGSSAPPASTCGNPAVAYAEMTETVRIFAEMHAKYGGGNLCNMLSQYLQGYVTPLLYKFPENRELFHVSAQLAHLMATMHLDAGQHSHARRCYGISYSLAHHARSSDQAAISLSALSSLATLLKQTGYAYALAESSVAAVDRSTPGGVKAYLYAQQALAHARHHHLRSALSALKAAENAHAVSNAGGPFSYYPLAALDYQRAQVLTALGEHAHAQQAYQASINRRPAEQHRQLALTHARCAHAFLGTGALEEACHHWNQFLDHRPRLHSALANQEVARLIRSLSPYAEQHHVARTLERARRLIRCPQLSYTASSR
ncbi:hypothetical protein ABT160_44990 [Streptomyces sp. NPDC001941]|uniref:hypothetical protein n=1 Tax=Streptomyces sp. NPDC001941 TaxID=3154659 RepID=UPI003322F495